MGNRFKREIPFAFYDPERDLDGQKHYPSRPSPIPLSPRAMLSPRAQPPGLAFYDPEQDHELYAHKDTMYWQSEPPVTSLREQLFGYYDPELDGVRGLERDRQGPPIRHLDPESAYRSPQNTSIGGMRTSLQAFSPSLDEELAGESRRVRVSGYGHNHRPTHDTSGRLPIPVDPQPARVRPMRSDLMDEDDLLSRGASSGRGKVSSAPPRGAGLSVFDGMQQPKTSAFEENLDVPPAPISSDYAHQVYATVFTDPVYNSIERTHGTQRETGETANAAWQGRRAPSS